MSATTASAAPDVSAGLQQGAQQAAVQFARFAGRATFGPDVAALRFLDEWVGRQRPALQSNPNAARQLTQALGCFIGQCIVDLYRGRWQAAAGYPVDMPRAEGPVLREFPFQFATRMVAGQASMSVADYVLTEIPRRLAERPAPPAPARPPLLRAVDKFAVAALQDLAAASRIEDLGFTMEAVAFLDKHITAMGRQMSTPEQRKLLINRLGAFLGQAVVEVFHGEWVLGDQGQPVVRIVRPDKVHDIDPFAKVTRRVDNGLADNLEGWFNRLLPLMLGVEPPQPGRRGAKAAVATTEMAATELESLRTAAARVLHDLDLAAFGYSAAAVTFVDQYLEETQAATAAAHLQAQLVRDVGAFVGECVQRVYGGCWHSKNDGTPCMVLSVDEQKLVLDPMGMVARRIRQGAGASLDEWFARTLPLVALPAAARLVSFGEEKKPTISRRFLDMFIFRG